MNRRALNTSARLKTEQELISWFPGCPAKIRFRFISQLPGKNLYRPWQQTYWLMQHRLQQSMTEFNAFAFSAGTQAYI